MDETSAARAGDRPDDAAEDEARAGDRPEDAAEDEARAGDRPDDAVVDDLAQELQQLNVQPQVPRCIYFSVGTTGFERDSHIRRISASEGEYRPMFVLSENPNDIQVALEVFINFLQQGPPLVLGHNIWRFGCPRLLKALQACGLVTQFEQLNPRFVDTLPLFKEINQDMRNYDLPSLYTYYTGEDLNNLERVRALQCIVEAAKLTQDQLQQHSFSLQEMRIRAERARTWQDLIDANVITRYIADNASREGFSFIELRTEFVNNGEAAARQMLRDRLRTTEPIINSICTYLQNMQENAGDNQ